jgi:hypothetical protein
MSLHIDKLPPTGGRTMKRKVNVECECGMSVVLVDSTPQGEIIWDDMTTWGTCEECGEDVLVDRYDVPTYLGFPGESCSHD